MSATQEELRVIDEQLQSCRTSEERIDLLLQLTFDFQKKDIERSRVLAEEARLLCLELNDKKRLARSLHLLGRSEELLFDFGNALKHLREALALFTAQEDAEMICQCNNLMGKAYTQLSDFPNALECFHRNISMAEAQQDQRQLVNSMINVGILHSRIGDYDKSISLFEEAIAISRESKNEYGLAFGLINIGAALMMQERYDEGIEAMIESAALMKNTGDLINYSNVIGNIAAGYIRTGRIDEAERFLRESFDVKEKAGDHINQATNHLTWALLWRKRKNYDRAITHLDTAMEIALKNENEHLEKNVCNGYYELYEETGDTANALKYYKKLHELEKKLLSEEKNRQLKNIQVKHEVDTIQKEKEIYRLKNIDLAHANEEISRQKDLIEEKNKDITDSINYAKRIQRALLANDASFSNFFSDWFLLYRPKDIVSGDFYWAAEEGDKLIFAVCDCTGHGVPGAFMSLLNISYLNEAVGEKKLLRPDLVMNHVRERIIRALSESSGELGAKDGMDAVIGCYDKKTKRLEFAASNNPLWLLRQEELIEFRPDKMPVGRHDGADQPFTLQSVQLQEGDTVFLFTDGFADQFGGPKGKKFKYRQLAEQLILHRQSPMQEQQSRLEKTFDEWKGMLEQVDDVLLFGFKP